MSTIWEKFPGADANKATLFPASATFTASLAAGKFSWVASQVQGFEMDAGDLAVLDGITIAANIDQLVFSKALQAPFQICLVRGGNRRKVGLAPFVFGAFAQGEGFSANWKAVSTLSGKEAIIFQLDGVLNQVTELVGYSSVSIFLTANVYLCKTGFMKGF